MVKVLGDRVLVALPPRENETTLASGLILMKDPELRTETRGVVVALGEKTGSVRIDDVECMFNGTIQSLREHECGRLDGECCINTVENLLSDLALMKPPRFDVAVGDVVLFPSYVGEKVEDGDVRYVFLREHEIIGVQEPLMVPGTADSDVNPFERAMIHG